MAQEAHRLQVQHCRLALLAHPVREILRDLERELGVVARRVLVAQLRPRAQRRLDPAVRRADADADAVVLAHPEERQRQPLMREVRGAVQPGLCRRMVDGRVAEAADDDRALLPLAVDADSLRTFERERDADRARQVRGDRRRLRDDRELVIAEDLVPAAGDRLVPRRGDALQDVGNTVAAELRCAREVERTRAVVQQRRVGRLERERDGGIRLVPGRRDRVEASTGALEMARGEVAEPAAHLRAPDRLRLGDVAAARAPRQLPQPVEQVCLERVHVAPT
jgi:hypothetical protein